MVAHNGLFRGTRTGPLRAVLCLCAVIAAITLAPASAAATIVDHTKSTEPYDFVQWDCGYPVHVVGTTSDNVHVRADKNPDIVYVTDNYAFRETWTASDGRWFTLSGNGLAKDVKATRVSGTLYEFTFHSSGNPATVTDATGKILYRDRGNLSYHYTIDLATGEFNFLGVKVSGPHATADTDLCKIVAPLIGTDSARYLTPRPIGSTSFPMGFYEYLPPSYSATGAKSPLLVVFNGYGESGDGTPGALQNLLNTGIPRFIDIGGWPTDRPLAVLALQHVEGAPGFDFSPCDGATWGGSCNMQAAARPEPRVTRLLHDAGRGPLVHRLRGGPLQRRPEAGLRHGPLVRRLRDLGIPGEVRRRAGGGRGADRRRRTARVGRPRLWPRLGRDLGIPR